MGHPERAPRGGQRPARRPAGTWLARRVRQLRISRGLSRYQLAGLAGVSAQTLGRIEGRGADTRHSVLVALARALHVSLLAFDPASAPDGGLGADGELSDPPSADVTSPPDFS